MNHLISPHGGMLSELLVSELRAKELKRESIDYQSINLTPRQLCDLELLLNGAFYPLTGFLVQKEYESVLDNMRLTDGTVWPIPITLDITKDLANSINIGDKIALRDGEGFLLAVLHVKDIWEIDKEREALTVFGTKNPEHPGVNSLFAAKDYYVGGELEGIQLPIHHDYKMYRFTPSELRARFEKLGWQRIVAFQTRNPLHCAHMEMTLRAAKEVNGNLLLHPVVGMTRLGDIDHYTRVRCYLAVSQRYPPNLMMMSLLPLAMRFAGPREALWHAVIRKNYGCTHFIIGRDHAGTGYDSSGGSHYDPYEAQRLVQEYEDEIEIKMVPFKEVAYVPKLHKFLPLDEIPRGYETINISGTELRRRLDEGIDIPEWFTFPEVIQELRRSYLPRSKQGLTVFFTGLPCSGTSTLANALMVKFLEMGDRPVTLLDGDIVRKNLSSELGFSKEHRDLNIMRIGFVASEITKNRGIAICAPIAPYEKIRNYNRKLISQYGGYIEVYVSTPLEICEQRDTKGLYAKARAGIINGFTGISDPYEPPKNPELKIDTTSITPEEGVQEILQFLEKRGYIK